MYRSKVVLKLYGWAFILIFLIMFNCSFKDPAAPNWDAKFRIPLMDETYTMQEWADDEKDLFIDENETVFFKTRQNINDIAIRDYMNLGNIDTVSYLSIIPISLDTIWEEKTLLDENIIVKEAEIRSGRLELTITNRTDLNIELTFVLPALTLAGESSFYSIQRNMIPGQVLQAGQDIPVEDLAGATFRPLVVNGKNVIKYGILANYPIADYSFYNDVEIDLKIDDIILDNFTGCFNELAVTMDVPRDTLDLPEELDGVMLGPTNAFLSLMSSSGNIPGKMDVEVSMSREDGQAESLNFQNMPFTTNTEPVVLPGIEPLLNIYPDYIEISGEILLGNGYDENNLVYISYDDYLTGKAQINAPLIFQFPANWINEVPVDTLDLYDEKKEKEKNGDPQTNEIIRDNVNSAGIIAIAENHFPFGARVTFIFSKMRGDSTIYMFTHPTDVVKAIDLLPGETAGSGAGTGENPNFVLNPSSSTFDLVLTKEELELFESPEVYIGMRIQFHQTNALVKVFPTDYITIKARIEASLNTKIPEDKDEEGGAS